MRRRKKKKNSIRVWLPARRHFVTLRKRLFEVNADLSCNDRGRRFEWKENTFIQKEKYS